MAAFDRAEKEPDRRRTRSVIPSANPGTRVAADSADELTGAGLTSRQAAVLRMQQTHGNAAVCRMLAARPGHTPVQRALWEHENVDVADDSYSEPASSPAQAAAPAGANKPPQTPTLTGELFATIQGTNNASMVAQVSQANMKTGINGMVRDPGPIGGPMSPIAVVSAQDALTHYTLLEQLLPAVGSGLNRINGAINASRTSGS